MLAEEIMQLEDESFVLGPGEGKQADRFVTIKVRGEDTGGSWAALEATLPGRTSGPPLHINSREDEMLYIVAGTLRVQLGQRIMDVTKGSMVCLPRGSVHTFCNPFSEPVSFVGVLSPAGFERYFEEAAEILDNTPDGEQPDREKLQALIKRYGGIQMGPPLPLTEEI